VRAVTVHSVAVAGLDKTAGDYDGVRRDIAMLVEAKAYPLNFTNRSKR
jgi:hypothetical protein